MHVHDYLWGHDYFHVQSLHVHYTVHVFLHVLHRNTFTVSLSMCTLNRFILANDLKIAKFKKFLTDVVERKTTKIIDEQSQNNDYKVR